MEETVKKTFRPTMACQSEPESPASHVVIRRPRERSSKQPTYSMYGIEHSSEAGENSLAATSMQSSLSKRLLFVDDEPSIRATLPVILRRYGFQVAVAATVAEALQEIKTKTFDLLLCDLNIDREGDGYVVVKEMREANPSCVVVILTGYPELDSAIEGIHLAVDDYIVKPADVNTLVAILAEKLLARKKESNTNPQAMRAV